MGDIIAYVGQTRSRVLIETLRQHEIGECTQPREYPPRRQPWFLDNAAFRAWKAKTPWDEAGFSRVLNEIRPSSTRPDFVVAPDIVAGGEQSLSFSASWVSRLVDVAPIYLAVQDGMTVKSVRAEVGRRGYAGLFVGGSRAWKIETGRTWTRLAHDIGARCHVGRAGTAKMVRWVRRIGADSLDSCLPLWSSDNLRVFLNALKAQPQLELELEPEGVHWLSHARPNLTSR